MASKHTYIREVQLKYKLKRIKDGGIVGKEFTDAKTIFNLFLDIRNDVKEKLYLICLDENQKIVCFELIAIGSDSDLFTNQREIFRTPILISAHGIILVHNHPIGNSKPSKDDKNFTKEIAPTAKSLGFDFIDHIIISSDDFFSFREKKSL